VVEKKKKIRKDRSRESEDDSDYRRARKNKNKKPASEKVKGYPTKNFLPPFKIPHLDFLRLKLGEEMFNSYHILTDLTEKRGVSMLDYQNIYKIPEFNDIFEEFFSKKILYRDLMLSRALP